MKIKFEKVLERDIDLLLINKLSKDREVLEYFLNKVNESNYAIESIEHSLMDKEDGESDITVILTNGKEKLAFLIEDKIDALAMPNQRGRYDIRGNKGIHKKLYNKFYVFMIAPKDYLETNSEAQKYENTISYEELINLMDNDEYALSLLNKALEEKRNGYIIIENEAVTQFWNKYYDFIKTNYPLIKFHEIKGPRGSKAVWPELLTDYKHVRIMHKSDRGFLDLTFEKFGENINIFNKYTEGLIPENFKVVKTGKSLSIRAEVKPIDFSNDFDNYISEMHDCMQKAIQLYDLLNKINVLMMYEEIENKNIQISNLEDFKKYYPNGIIVNYDKRVTYRCSTNKCEKFADIVEYPYVQRYQTGSKTKTELFMIRDEEIKLLKRIDLGNPDSNYYMDDIYENVSDAFYSDDKFNKIDVPPVNVGSEVLLEIENIE